MQNSLGSHRFARRSKSNGGKAMAANAAPLIHAKKVLIITACYPPNIKFGGGLAFTYSALSRRLSQRGADVTVLSPQVRASHLQDRSSVVFIILAVMSVWNLFFTVAYL